MNLERVHLIVGKKSSIIELSDAVELRTEDAEQSATVLSDVSSWLEAWVT